MTESQDNFEKAKKVFFGQEAMRAYSAYKEHSRQGLWKDVLRVGPDGRLIVKSWKEGVSKHCLVVQARAEVLGEWLGIPDETMKKMRDGAALHDISKPVEYKLPENLPEDLKVPGQTMPEEYRHPTTWESYNQAVSIVDDRLREAGFDEETIRLSGAMGHSSLIKTRKILVKSDLAPYDWAYLINHYSDDISDWVKWVTPAEMAEDGRKINVLDRRIDKNENSGQLDQLNEDGILTLGEKTFDAQRRIGHAVEVRLADELKARGIFDGNPLDLPQFIDQKIREKINAVADRLNNEKQIQKNE